MQLKLNVFISHPLNKVKWHINFTGFRKNSYTRFKSMADMPRYTSIENFQDQGSWKDKKASMSQILPAEYKQDLTYINGKLWCQGVGQRNDKAVWTDKSYKLSFKRKRNMTMVLRGAISIVIAKV